MSMQRIGDLCEVRGDLIIEWKIKTFSSLFDERNSCYNSPKFYFYGASWCLTFYPYGDKEADDYASIFLTRLSTGSRVVVDFAFGIKTPDGNICLERYSVSPFGNFSAKGFKFFLRSTLMDRRIELIPSDELTILCSLKSREPNVISESLFHRLELVSRNLKDIYKSGKKTDLTLKIGEDQIPAHRIILETRSPVFEAMLTHDTIENQTTEVSIEDYDKSTVDNILCYLYSGDMGKLDTDNVLSLYAAAKKYDIKEVKDMCLKFILRNLSAEWMCDIIHFTNMYNDEEVSRHAREYFIKHSGFILNTDKWRSFVKKSPEFVLNFLG